jgi:hypothetical protein
MKENITYSKFITVICRMPAVGESVTELTPLTKEWPLLRECKIERIVPRRISRVLTRENMLHHARLLIVRFLDQKGIAPDTIDGR